MRKGGFSGFSFREIAVDVGVKSSSVHYHFPTKENLAAAVIQRYTAQTADLIERELQKEPNPVKVWVKAFRGTLHSEDRMCPCAVLGASTMDLPSEVSAEVKKFFKMCHEKLVEEGLSSDEASQLLATITGALVVANAVNDFATYDRATREYPSVETCAAESWSPTREEALSSRRVNYVRIAANEGPLGRSAIRRRAVVGEETDSFLFARPSSARSPDPAVESWLIVAIHSEETESDRYEKLRELQISV